MPTLVARTVRAVTLPSWWVALPAWVASLVDVSPWGFDLPPDAFLFVIAGACVSSYACIAQAHARPAHELYVAGKAEGRRLALLELSCDKVAPLPERRLRAVRAEPSDAHHA